MKIEETEALTFTYDRRFNTSQRHSKLSMNQTEPSGKVQQREIAYFALVNDGTLRTTADFASALSNVNNVKRSDLLAFLVMQLFSSRSSHLKIICDGGVLFQKVARLWKHSWWRFFFDNFTKSLVEASFHFQMQFCKTILDRLLSYKATLCKKKCNKLVL